MKIGPDAAQNDTIDLGFAGQATEKFLRIFLLLKTGVFQQYRPIAVVRSAESSWI